ncbi:beta-hexosaminidase subunit beta-like [Haliotis asinina]|uniref:beta-hexosaminidase subunit beta-like n=1 Tax=Haliotis asinina TaxID=109174 RepID=UPI0035318C06
MRLTVIVVSLIASQVLTTDALRPRARVIRKDIVSNLRQHHNSSATASNNLQSGSGKVQAHGEDQLGVLRGKALQNGTGKSGLPAGTRPKKKKYKMKKMKQRPGTDTKPSQYLVTPVDSMKGQNRGGGSGGGRPRNPVMDFLENKRPKPIAEAKSKDSLTNDFNEMKRLPQNDHPASDQKNGDMRVKWDRDMFFIRWAYGSLGDQLAIRRAPHASIGAPWPLPRRYARNEKKVFKVDEGSFKFVIKNHSCDTIELAIERFRNHIVEDAVEDLYDNLQNAENTNINDPQIKYESDVYKQAPELKEVEIIINRPCVKYPSLDMDESYRLVIKDSSKRIVANEVWGALRGLETFSQLVWRGTDRKLYVMETIALDKPRFPHRGVLIDTARHFIFKDVIYDVLRGMEQNKLNVFHWHMTDDQSFPFQSETFPEMSAKGAYHPSYTYTHEDIADIVEFARLRGIRVIPEFDVPGHTYAWGHGRPELVTKCYNDEDPTYGMVGPIDPSKDATYAFLKELFREILDLFPDQYIHAGGDEVPSDCWKANDEVMKSGTKLVNGEKGLLENLEKKIKNTVTKFREQSVDAIRLWEYFQNRFMQDVKQVSRSRVQGVKFILWQEASTKTGIKMVNDTVAQIWLGDALLMREAIQRGYRVLYSACWYLDMVSFGPDWYKYYSCDPAFPGQGVDETRVLGGEACLWSEYVDNENLMARLWPRASAAAERLWSARDVKDLDEAAPRLQEQRCRMLSRGLSVDTISGPDYCLRKGRVGGHDWTVPGVFSVRRPYGSVDMFKDSMLVIVQVIVVMLLLFAIFKSHLPFRVFETVRHTRHSTIFLSFLGLIGISMLIYSGLWAWSIS